MTTPTPCEPIWELDPPTLRCSSCEGFATAYAADWVAHVTERAEANFKRDFSAHGIAAFSAARSEDGKGYVASADCSCGDRHVADTPDPALSEATALADWAAHIWAVGMLGDAPALRPTRSCATCANVDTTLRNDDLIMECHLAPPCTMPPAPALPEITATVDDEPTELVVTVRGGTLLADLEAVLADKGQHLAFEPPRYVARGTVGGMVAAGLAGPARATAGGVRDTS